jgi:hypothetical protein
MSDKKYYKVVHRHTRKSGDVLYSAMDWNLHRDWVVEYKVGVESKPIMNSKLFVFDNRPSARAFMKTRAQGKEYELYECSVTNPAALNHGVIYRTWISDVLRRFWNNECNEGSIAPASTCICDSVTLVRRIPNQARTRAKKVEKR